MTATAAGANRIDLSWSASTDTESGVGGYRVFQDGLAIDTTTTTSYAATGLAPNTTYTFTVAAFDNAVPANESAPSTPASATTDVAPTWQNQDIGAVGAVGSFTDNAGTLTIEGSGADIWNTADEFHFAYQTLDGDGEIVARLTGLANTHDWAKAGVMMRDQLTANSRFVHMLQTVNYGAVLQYRMVAGTSAAPSGLGDLVNTLPRWLRLVRQGDVFTGYVSTDGINWTIDDTVTMPLPQTVYVGLAVTSHNDGVLTTAVFDNVSVIQQ